MCVHLWKCVHGRALGWSPAAGPSLVCFNIAAAAAVLLLASGHHAKPTETQRKHRQRGGESQGGMRRGSRVGWRGWVGGATAEG